MVNNTGEPNEIVSNAPLISVTTTNRTTRPPGGIPWLNIRTSAFMYMLTVHVETQRFVVGTSIRTVVVARGKTFTTMNLVVLRTKVLEVKVRTSSPIALFLRTRSAPARVSAHVSAHHAPPTP